MTVNIGNQKRTSMTNTAKDPAMADREIVTKRLFAPDPEIDYRIESATERHRKGFGELVLRDADGTPTERATIELRQVGHAFGFGCNLFLLDQFEDAASNAAYEQAFTKLFNQAVLPFYWSDLEPEPGQVRYGVDSKPVYRRPPPDRCLEFCERNGIAPKGHPLLWSLFFPEWLPREPQALAAAIERRFASIADRYGERIGLWDVCNEALACAAVHPIRAIGDHVALAFELAQRYFPKHCCLTYNDTTMNSWRHFHGEQTPMYMLVEGLARRFDLGAIGLQYHFFARNPREVESYHKHLLDPANVYRHLDLYGRLGLPLKISEVTVPGYTMVDEGEQFQAQVTERLYRLWFSHPLVDEITWWNLVDGTACMWDDDGSTLYAPKENNFEGENFFRGGLTHRNLQPKAAYKALDRLINHEWHTTARIEYTDGVRNTFHGFYGDYEATITHADGTSTHRFAHAKGNPSPIEITLTPASEGGTP